MTTSANTLIAAEHSADLQRVAARRRQATPLSGASNPTNPVGVTLRLARLDDADLVHRLEALDDAPALDGRVLLALIGGEAVAALSLYDRRVVANPFVFTEQAIVLLRLRADHLVGRRPRGRLRLRRPLRPRFA
jgi:hypothetical protein